MTGLHDSTLALSVYTALVRHGSMSRATALDLLKRAWDPRVDISEIDAGVAYLLARQMITESGVALSPTQFRKGAARTVVRSANDQTELVFT